MTNDQIIQTAHQVAIGASQVLGASFTICTVIGNALSRSARPKISSLGHVVLAFGADIAKARKRIVELFGGSLEE